MNEGYSKEEYVAKCKVPDYDKYFNDADEEFVGDYLTVDGIVKVSLGENEYGYKMYVLERGIESYVICDYSAGNVRFTKGNAYKVYGRYAGLRFVSDDSGFLPVIYFGYISDGMICEGVSHATS